MFVRVKKSASNILMKYNFQPDISIFTQLYVKEKKRQALAKKQAELEERLYLEVLNQLDQH
jgi:hypothetical protein